MDGKSDGKQSTVSGALLALDWHTVDRQPIIFDAAVKVTIEMCQLFLQSSGYCARGPAVVHTDDLIEVR